MALKDQLEAAGYDTSGFNEQDMLKQLDAAGYDVSSLQPQPNPQTTAKSIGRAALHAIPGAGAAVNAVQLPEGAQGPAAQGIGMTVGEALGGPLGAGVGNAAAGAAINLAHNPHAVQAAQSVASHIPEGPSSVAMEMLQHLAKVDPVKAKEFAQKMGVDFGVGTALGMAGKVVGAGLEKAGQFLARPGAEEAMAMSQKMLSEAGTPGQDAARKYAADRLTSLRGEVADISKAQANLPASTAARRAAASQQIADLKLQMGEVEKKMGIDFKPSEAYSKLIDNADGMTKMAAKLQDIAAQGPEAVAKNFSPQDIQAMRKTAWAGKNAVDSATKGALGKSEYVFKQALGKLDKQFAEVDTNLKQAYQYQKDLPNVSKEVAADLKTNLISAKQALMQEHLELKQLMREAQGADAVRLYELKQQAAKLISQGKTKDAIIKAATGFGLGLTGLGAGFGGYQIAKGLRGIGD